MNKESINKCIDNAVIKMAHYIGSFNKKPPKAFEVNSRTASDKISKYLKPNYNLTSVFFT